MSGNYVKVAVVSYVRALKEEGALASRPVRMDGFTQEEIADLVLAVCNELPGVLVSVLSGFNREGTAEINAERATRYRNQVDATNRQEGFILFVPLGQIVESSLDEPAFRVVSRSRLFAVRLARLRQELSVSLPELRALREAAVFRQPESLYAFLSSWNHATGQVEAEASHRYLGLLADSSLHGNMLEVTRRLHRNAQAVEILLRPGASASRTLDDLANKVGLNTDQAGDDVLALQAWWRNGRQGTGPASLDFACWPLLPLQQVEIRWQEDLSQAPHSGFRKANDQVEVASPEGTSKIEWEIVRRTPLMRFELELVEDVSREVVKCIGKTKSSRRQVRWRTLFKDDETRDLLTELNPGGEVEGFLFRIRLKIFDGPRWVEQVESKPFSVELVPPPAEDVLSKAAPSAYHALYEFHSKKATDPVLRGITADSTSPCSVIMTSAEGKEKQARLDLSPRLLALEQALLDEPRILGTWRVASPDGSPDGVEKPQPLALPSDDVVERYLKARETFFAAAREAGCIEGADLRDPSLRPKAEAYLESFEAVVGHFEGHVTSQGALSNADRQHLAAISASDTLEFEIPADDGGQPYHLLGLAPTHPTTIAWLLEFQDLVWSWSRGKYDRETKPPYEADSKTPAVLGGVEGLNVGPRVMVIATTTHGSLPRSWGFAGCLSALWQCFIPVGSDVDIRGRDWSSQLVSILGLTRRPIGTGRMDARRIGTRIKKYAVLHPYVSQLKMTAVMAGDGSELLDALRVMDEKQGVPQGAQSISDIRYEVTLLGPDSDRFGAAIDDLTLNPGDDRWRRYASAILDNPETVLAPGFAYAKRRIDFGTAQSVHQVWTGITGELQRFGEEGVHVTVLGPMLATTVGSARAARESSFRNRGLSARPAARGVTSIDSSPFEGNWLLSLSVPKEDGGNAIRGARALSRAVDLAHGVYDRDYQTGLEVALSGSVSEGLRVAHEVSDWVVIADPLFSIELLDQAKTATDAAVLLDFSPEFDPYPGGRIVVTTKHLREVEALGSSVAEALSSTGTWTSILASISARLLLTLANPTKQVVHGLAGLALSRVYLGSEGRHPLVIPIDGHEGMFVLPRLGRGQILADFLVVDWRDHRLELQVVESKWTTRGNLESTTQHGIEQAGTTAEVVRAAYIEYAGVDRALRLDNLREIIAFHLARARRHAVPFDLVNEEFLELLKSDETFSTAEVGASVLVWCPDGAFGSQSSEERDGVTVRYFDAEGIRTFGALMNEWPLLSAAPAETGGTPTAIETIVDETILDDQKDRQRRGNEEQPATAAPGAPSEARTEASLGPAVPGPRDAGTPSQRPAEPDYCIRLGSLKPSGTPALWCPPRLSNGHLIIIGGSGAGKTTALRHISGGIASRDVPVLVLDFHGDIEVPGEGRLYSFDYSGNRAFINPFHLDRNLGARLTPSRLKWEFLEAWNSVYPSMGVHQTNFLASMIEDAFGSAGISENPDTWSKDVTFADVLTAFENSDAPDSVRSRIESYMKRFTEWRIFHGGEPISVESFLSGSTRLDLSQLDESARNILADVVLRRLFLLVRALGPLDPSTTGWGKFRCYVVIDEAQILMASRSDAKASLAKYAAEARKFGVGLILATQLKDNVPSDIWGNIDTRLFMQALDQGERSRNAKAANVPEAMLKSLSRGEAILTSSSQPNAVPVVLKIEPIWMAERT